ncbi:MAG: ATP-binding cassette domain-containing protein [Candidatus Thermoplasmatota archaeon]|jgi:energy-coupling factor transport system ATP-binding protein|nr:ATP-binding cassette domain-containing protein [Candidatus Thermoplasmatota archaeon]MCL5988509.1 ATP-binding cassette domain-containing protein [Candidatus Thermoplasmatota archaeon]
MKALEIHDLKFYYMGREEPAINIEHLSIEDGETVLITGRSGGGKSTLVNCITGIIPHVIHGEFEGQVEVYGHDTMKTQLSKLSTEVGIVLQNPENQVLNYTVEEEVAFGPENLCLEQDDIFSRVKESIETTGTSQLVDRETYTLSGGELQRVAIAAVLSMRPKLLILDEPTSNIDPEGTARVFDIIKRLKEEKTLIVVEHKVERVLPFVDRIIVIDQGKILLDIKSSQLPHYVEKMVEMGIEVPIHYIYAKKNGIDSEDMDTIREKLREKNMIPEPPRRAGDSRSIMHASVKVSTSEGKELVKGEIDLEEKHILAIMGRNGAGKSTFLKGVMGFLDMDLRCEMEIELEGRDISREHMIKRGKEIAFVPQNFDLTLISKTVEREVEYSLKKRKIREHGERVEKLLDMFTLSDLRYRDPLSLSLGQRRRVSMASAMASGVKIIMLDEPTSGQDYYHKQILGKELTRIKEAGYSIIIVTHDSRFVYRFADRVVVFNNGRKVLDGTPESVFRESRKYSIIPPSDFVLRNDEHELVNS